MTSDSLRACIQVLYSYPPEAQASPELPAFCFPHGVQPTLLERTPSMSSLNDLLYSQNYLNSDASSFIFLLKVSINRDPFACTNPSLHASCIWSCCFVRERFLTCTSFEPVQSRKQTPVRPHFAALLSSGSCTKVALLQLQRQF